MGGSKPCRLAVLHAVLVFGCIHTGYCDTKQWKINRTIRITETSLNFDHWLNGPQPGWSLVLSGCRALDGLAENEVKWSTSNLPDCCTFMWWWFYKSYRHLRWSRGETEFISPEIYQYPCAFLLAAEYKCTWNFSKFEVEHLALDYCWVTWQTLKWTCTMHWLYSFVLSVFLSSRNMQLLLVYAVSVALLGRGTCVSPSTEHFRSWM
jgi:hypothetical protein